MRKKILIITNDTLSFKDIKKRLETDNTKLFIAHSIDEGLDLFVKGQFFLVILDSSFSREESSAFLSRIHNSHQVPILILSGMVNDKHNHDALGIVSDNFLDKPDGLSASWDRAECLMQNYMRSCRDCQRGYTLIFGGNLIIDPIGRQVSLNGEELQLTRKEFDLLFCLASHAGQVLSREQLYQMAWDENSAYNVDETVKAHIKSLRKKLTPAGAEYIKNVWGIGYRFSADEDKEQS